MSILLNLFCIYNKRNLNFIYKEDFIMPINKNELTKEMIEKAMQCETAEDLVALAKSEGIEITKAEAEAYMAEMGDVELDSDALKQVAGGGKCYKDCTHIDCGSVYVPN